MTVEDFCPVLHQSKFMLVELHIVIMMMVTMMVIITSYFIIAIIDNNIFLPYRWSFTPSHESLHGANYCAPVIQPEANIEQTQNKATRDTSGDQSAMILDPPKKGKKSLKMAIVVSFGWGGRAVLSITEWLGRTRASAVYMTLNPVRHLSWWAGSHLSCSHKVIRCMQSSVEVVHQGNSSGTMLGLAGSCDFLVSIFPLWE